ncbi:MAG: class I SAM-dependent methyltransferase [Bacteroidota bacterium]|jgi:ubiquinone/menaquinone biosynthesis C-methylase UbiE
MTWEETVLWLREQNDKRELVMASYFDDPLPDAAERFNNSSEWKAVQKILADSKKGKALDIGAGRGISSYALAKDGWEVTALEPDNSEIVGTGAIEKLIAESGLKIEIVQTYGEKLPFEDNTLDFVNARQVLHHAQDLKLLCKEIFRVLKKNGILLASREHVLNNRNELQIFLDSHELHKFYGGENAFTLDEYRNALTEAGFDTIKILKTYDSDINLFPVTKVDIRNNIKTKLKFNVPDFLFNLLLKRMNNQNNVPGRLFSFVCVK